MRFDCLIVDDEKELADNTRDYLKMRSFGIMKCTMILPMDLMIITVIFIIGISLIGTILMSLRIRKVQPQNLLVGE